METNWKILKPCNNTRFYKVIGKHIIKWLLVLFCVYRSIRKWWVALPTDRRQYFREWAWQKRWHLATLAGVAMVTVSLLLLTHLEESPMTGRTRLLVFSRESYMELAALTSEAVREKRARSKHDDVNKVKWGGMQETDEGRRRLLWWKIVTLKALGCVFQYMEEFAELLLPVTDVRHQVVERLVEHLAQRNKDIPQVSDVSWTVHVVQSPTVNAFVLPVG